MSPHGRHSRPDPAWRLWGIVATGPGESLGQGLAEAEGLDTCVMGQRGVTLDVSLGSGEKGGGDEEAGVLSVLVVGHDGHDLVECRLALDDAPEARLLEAHHAA